jgi:PAS domain S-box-containing protein
MKLSTKIYLYIIFVCLAIILGAFYESNQQRKVVDLYVTKMMEQKAVLFNTVTELKGEPLKKVLAENTLWDELIKYFKVKDPKWAQENLHTFIDIHKANVVWLYDKDFKLVYSAQNLNDDSLNKFPESNEIITNLFKNDKFPHFFITTKSGLCEFFAATVHPTNDFKRETKPQGYFFVGKTWDKNYENELEQIIDGSIDIVFKNVKDTLNLNPNAVTFIRTINSPWNNKEIATVKVSKDITQLKDMEEVSKKYFINAFLFFILFVCITSFLFWKWIFIPLKNISSSLKVQNTLDIEDLERQQNPFGNIAKLIKSFFEQKNKIEESEKKFKDMFENNAAVMLLIDPYTSNIVDANISSSLYYGYSREELINKNLAEIDSLPKEELQKELTKALNGRNNYFEYKHKLSGGELKDVEVYSNPISVNNRLLVFSIIHDITERNKIKAELLKAKDAAENAALIKSQFLSNMSHEIRTPLNAIIGLTDLLIQENFSLKNSDNLKAVKFSADHLLHIINDILDFSKIEAGKISLERIDFNLGRLIDSLIKSISVKAKDIGLEIKSHIDKDIPSILVGDPTRLQQVLLNLTGNSLKITKKGFIEIDVTLINKDGNNINLLFEVKDSGIGIPEHKLEQIFESFTQAYADTSRKFGGTGLGLAISKRLVELQGGNFGVKSKVDEGSVFYFTLNFEISYSHEIEISEPIIISDKRLIGVNILLAEDNPMNQFFAKQLLNKWGVNVDLANNGREAVNFLEQKDFDIVLLDLQMPEMNGFDVVERIRDKSSNIKDHHIPVIALTADISTETRESVFKSGMDDFILKPFEQKDLYSKIIKYIEN